MTSPNATVVPKSKHLTCRVAILLVFVSVLCCSLLLINLQQLKDIVGENGDHSRSPENDRRPVAPSAEAAKSGEQFESNDIDHGTDEPDESSDEVIQLEREVEADDPVSVEKKCQDYGFVRSEDGNSVPSADNPIVETSTGKVKGVRELLFNRDVLSFKGIPYAEPPLGSLRFRRTVPKRQWPGIREATKLGPHCPQTPSVTIFRKYLTNEQSEDCLFMNIWTPATNGTRPIMFYIHGGGFDSGRVGVDENDGNAMSLYGDAVVVTFNYRLGALGWLNMDIDECPGNQGLYDVITAIEWIKLNAAAFGGDPNNILHFGQSAGGMIIGWLIGSPTYGHLFKRVLFQSGPPIYPTFLHKLISSSAQKATKLVGCDLGEDVFYDEPEKVVACMRTKKATSFLKTKEVIAGFVNFPSPNDDFPFTPYEALLNGSNGIDHVNAMLTGTNKDEASLFLAVAAPQYFPTDGDLKIPQNLTTVHKFAEFVVDYITARVQETRSRYFQLLTAVKQLVGSEPDEDEPEKFVRRAVKRGTKLLAMCGNKIFAEMFIGLNKTAYMYHFSQRSAVTQWPEWMGVTHSDELHFVFGHPLRYPDLYSAEDVEISKRMIRTWVNFAKTGQPLNQRGVEWPKYSDDGQEVMELKGMEAFVNREDDAKFCELYKIGLELTD